MVNYKIHRSPPLTIVNGQSGNNSIMDFQPASGVSICITTLGDDNTGGTSARLFDGTIASALHSTHAIVGWDPCKCELYINNTLYLRMTAIGSGKYSTFSGYEVS